MWAIGEPSGPIEKGTTYIVRPRIEPRKSPFSVWRISPGARQLFVGPASSSRSEQMKVRSSTRATSPGSERARYELGRLASESLSKVPASISCRQSCSYSSAEPSHQWTESASVSWATSSTHASSLRLVVRAGVACVTSATVSLHSRGRLSLSPRLSAARQATLDAAAPTLRFMRAVLRFLASVLIVSGVLLIGDAAATLLWQEPVSAVVAQRQQSKLEQALVDPPPRVLRKKPLPGDAIGRIEIPAIGVEDYVVEGTDTDNLRKGPGHYPETPLPGERGTAAIAGHRTTYGAPFRNIDDLDPGQVIRVDMPDGRFVYRVERVKIVDDQDLSVLEPVGYKRLMLSACHPLYSAAERVIVFARQVRREAAQGRRA